MDLPVSIGPIPCRSTIYVPQYSWLQISTVVKKDISIRALFPAWPWLLCYTYLPQHCLPPTSRLPYTCLQSPLHSCLLSLATLPTSYCIVNSFSIFESQLCCFALGSLSRASYHGPVLQAISTTLLQFSICLRNYFIHFCLLLLESNSYEDRIHIGFKLISISPVSQHKA